MNDIAQLAELSVAILAPHLPALLEYGKEAGKELIKKSVDETWDQAKALWSLLHPKLKEKDSDIDAIRDVVEEPDNPDAHAALRQKIKKLLAEDEELARRTRRVLESSRTGSGPKASYRSVAVEGGINGSVVITGDDNEVSDIRRKTSVTE